MKASVWYRGSKGWHGPAVLTTAENKVYINPKPRATRLEHARTQMNQSPAKTKMSTFTTGRDPESHDMNSIQDIAPLSPGRSRPLLTRVEEEKHHCHGVAQVLESFTKQRL